MTRTLSLLAALALGVASAQSTTQLTWKLEAGKERTEIVHTTTKITMSMPNGMEMNTTQEQTLWVVYKVESVEGDTAKVVKTTKRVVTKVNNPQLGEFTYDTDKPDARPENPQAAPVADQTQALVGSQLKYDMKVTGEISNVSADDALKAGAGGNLEESAKQSALVFPKELKEGDSWSTELEQEQGGMTTKVKNIYTYKGVKGDLRDFGFQQEMNMVPGPQMPIELKVTDQTSDGYYHFDTAKGWVSATQVALKLTLTMSGPQGQLSQNMDVVARSKVIDGVDTNATIE